VEAQEQEQQEQQEQQEHAQEVRYNVFYSPSFAQQLNFQDKLYETV